MADGTAAAYADEQVARVRDDPQGRLAFLGELYRVPRDVDRGYLPYRRAALAFMRWQVGRGVLERESSAAPGSPWWRAVNDSLLSDTCEASAIAFGRSGEPRTPGVVATLEFIREPTARSWYRAHNLAIASAYLANVDLARREGRVERFFVNLVLMRVLYAHALVAEPRLALGRLSRAGGLVGDPRLGVTGIFLSLSRVLPHHYPLGEDVDPYVEAEHGLGHALDVGVIGPRLISLYDWSADTLGLPALGGLLNRSGPTPAYAWDPDDAGPWHPTPSVLARVTRRLVR